MSESIEIVMLDDDDEDSVLMDTQLQASVTDLCVSSINVSKANSSPINSTPEFLATLNQIRQSIETMTRKKLEEFCFTKIKAEIELKSMYQYQLKENENINNNLCSAQVELSLLRDENNKLLQSLQHLIDENSNKPDFRDSSCQTNEKDFTSMNKNGGNKTGRHHPYLKVRDFSKQQQTDHSKVIVSSSSRMEMEPSTNQTHFLYVIPYQQAEYNQLQINNNVPINNTIMAPPFDPMLSLLSQTMPKPLDNLSASSHTSQPIPLAEIKPILLEDPSAKNIVTTQTSTPQNKQLDEQNKNFDIEDSLPHALITCSESSKHTSNIGKCVEVFNVLKSIDLTKSEGDNNAVPTTRQNSADLNNMPFIVSAMSLAPNSTATTIDTPSMPIIVSTESLAFGNSNTTTHNPVHNDPLSDISNDPKTDENTSDSSIPKTLAKILRKVNFGIVRPECQEFDSCSVSNSEPNDNTNITNSVVNQKNITNPSVNKTDETNSTILKINITSPVANKTKETNPRIFKINITGPKTNTETNANETSAANAIVNQSNVAIPETNVDNPTVKKKKLHFVSVPAKISKKVPSSSQTSTCTKSIVTSTPSTSSTVTTLKLPNSTTTKLSSLRLHNSKLYSAEQLQTFHVFQSEPKKMDCVDPLSSPPAKNVRMEDSPILLELEKQMSDKMQNDFINGNFSKGISIKLDIDGLTKIITCTNINMNSLKKMVSRQDTEKDAFVKVFAKAIYNKISKSVGFSHSGKMSIKRCDLIQETDSHDLPKLPTNSAKRKSSKKEDTILLID